ncbi:putative oxidoreductase [Methyloligella halotolerans]|uniref:Putative oxidoreductase n=1 Tax=Methyloligella halotolerans TaxID=1177755 RepID=A0A1E2S273_9HYPH|nr:SDR family oxidoreductase [Methyloligella halotolerans]ODA68458.1 putative oxidoreductase [Methyloligella halotolerans]
MANIEGKVVLITGASSGIGEVTARHLAKQGAKVMLGARRTDNLEKIVKDIKDAGGSAAFKSVDVVKRDEVDAFVKAAIDEFGKVDVIVNNAGLMPLSPLTALKVDEWDRMVDVNIKGTLYGIAAVLPLMKKQGSGQVINLSSVAGHVVFPGGAVYCGTKFAVRAISEGLRQENKDIRVTIISPGAVATELLEHITDEETAKMADGFGQIAISSQAIAESVAFAIGQPDDVDVNEMIVRPTVQDL